MKTNLFWSLFLFAAGIGVGYVWKLQENINYKSTIDAASAGKKLYEGVTEVIDLIKGSVK